MPRTIDEVEEAFKEMQLNNEELVKIAAQQSLLWESAYYNFNNLKNKIVPFLIKHPEFISEFVNFVHDDMSRMQKVAAVRADLHCSILDAVGILDAMEILEKQK